MSGYSSLEAATRASVEAATHLDKEGVHAGAIAAMISTARKIDGWDIIVDWALEDASEDDSRPKVPANDNVSLSTYLKYVEALGLTPAPAKGPKPPTGGAPANPLTSFIGRQSAK